MDSPSTNTTPLGEEKPAFDSADIVTVLTGWGGSNIYSLNNEVITFTKLDAELGLPSGASAQFLQEVATKAGAKLVRRGKETILFESSFPER